MEIKLYKLNKILFTWLCFLSFFVIYYLFRKHSVGNDSSISEWLINYGGGFTRRGFGGEIPILISNVFNISLRLSIFFVQIFFHLFYFLLFYFFAKNLKLNILQIFCLFSPIFLMFPLAEIESLGRKEIILFCFFLLIIIFSEDRFSERINNLLIIFILPLIILIWEQIVLFFPYILSVLILSRNQSSIKKILTKNFFLFLPSLITFIYLYLNPLSRAGHDILQTYLMNNFGEQCYMSCSLLITSTIYFDTFSFHKNANFEHYIRFILIFIIGFLPLHLMLLKNKFSNYKKNFISLNFKPIYFFFILYLPVILLFMYGYDWGRWMTIIYTFSFLFYLFLIKNNYISQKLYVNDFLEKKFYSNKKIIILFFVIFSFSWHQKTVITSDIGSIPVYRIVQKFVKFTLISR